MNPMSHPAYYSPSESIAAVPAASTAWVNLGHGGSPDDSSPLLLGAAGGRKSRTPVSIRLRGRRVLVEGPVKVPARPGDEAAACALRLYVRSAQDRVAEARARQFGVPSLAGAAWQRTPLSWQRWCIAHPVQALVITLLCAFALPLMATV